MHGRHFPFILLMLSGAASNVLAQPPIPRPVQTFPAQVFTPAVPQAQNVVAPRFPQNPIQPQVPVAHPDEIDAQLKSLTEQFVAAGLNEEARATAAIAGRIREAHFHRLLQAHQTSPEAPAQYQVLLRVQMAEFQVTPASLQLLGEFVGNQGLVETPKSVRSLCGVIDREATAEWLTRVEKEGFLQTSCRSQATVLNGRTVLLKFAPEANTSEPGQNETGKQPSDVPGDKLPFIGTTLKATAVVRENNLIKLNLVAENTTTSPAEGTSSKRMQSEIEVLDGQTVVMAGLSSTGTLTEVTRIPVLGDIPLLGRLFSNRKTSAMETELVLVVTPEIQATQTTRPNTVQPAAHVRPSR